MEQFKVGDLVYHEVHGVLQVVNLYERLGRCYAELRRGNNSTSGLTFCVLTIELRRLQ